MLKLYWWIKGRIKDWMFYRAYDKAPLQKLGKMWVKEVKGSLYAVKWEE